MNQKYFALGLIATTALLGCSKASPWEEAAAQLPKAQADARSAGLPTDMSELPKRGIEPGKNAATHYELALASWPRTAGGLREDAKTWSDAVSANATTVIIRKSLDKHRNMLSEVRKGLAVKECHFEMDPSLGLDAEHPEFAAMKDWAKALAAAAVLDARSGNVQGCQANLVGIQTLARHSAEENSILSQLVATAISKIGLRAGERVIGDGGAKFAPAIEAMAKAIPELKMADSLAIECAAGVVSIRNLNLDEPFQAELKAKIDKIREADANLSMGTIRKAFETRYLQYWVKVKKEAGSQNAEEFGKMIDRIAASEANLDATYLLNHAYTGTIHEQAGNAMASVTAKKNAALTLVAILRGSPAQSAAAKFGTKVEKTSTGYTITDKSYRPPAKAVLNAYAVVYPYRGQNTP